MPPATGRLAQDGPGGGPARCAILRRVRVKELTIQGFKSFANKHRFIFPTGITAIVGPNGSGKSNVADAIRWVLGEQRSTTLRARRVQDMIFAGTERRARAGLADVSLTFENADGWLAVDFPEVVVGRRALRDGTGGFAVNGAAVRMRDVHDLLGGRLGHENYTVIGQGLVDNALAMRPEERRVLIDEAAGLGPMQRKRDHTLRQLAEVDENLTRVRDILEELEPRLRRMARLAGRAERHREVAGELTAQLTTWYGHHLHRALAHQRDAHAAVATTRADADAARAAVASAEAVLRDAEARRDAFDQELAALRSRREAQTAAGAERQRAIAVAQARLDGLTARLHELEGADARAQNEIDDLRRRADVFAAEVSAIEALHAERSAVVDATRSALAAAEAEHDQQQQTVQARRAELFALTSEQAGRRQRLATLAAARAARQGERDQAASDLAGLEAQWSQAAAAQAAASEVATRAEADLAAVSDEVAAAEARQLAIQASLGAARDAHAAARAAVEALRARADTLEVLFAEVDETGQTVTRLRESGRVEVVGTVAELLEVDPEWERAAAAALGPHVQGIVVRDADAVAAGLHVALPEARGTVTLVPLSAPAGAGPRWTPGAGEVAATAVAAAPAAPGLGAILFGDVVFTTDRAAAVAALARHAGSGPTRAATRDGVLVLASGVTVAGTPAQSLLEIQRERRRLPAAVAAAASEQSAAAAEVDRLTAERQLTEGVLGGLADRRAAAARARAQAAAALEQARIRAERAGREQSWAMETIERLDRALAELAADAAAIAAAVEADAPRETTLQVAIEAAESGLQPEVLADLRAGTAAAAAALAEAAQQRAGRRAMLQAAEADFQAALQRQSADASRAAQIAAQIDDLGSQVAALRQASDAEAATASTLEAEAGPAEAQAHAIRLELRHLGAALDAARHRVSAAEAAVAEARIAATRVDDRIERMGDQLRADAEWLPFALPDDLTPAALAELPLAAVDALPEGFDAALDGLRRQMRAIGPIDQEALGAYEETADRFALLGDQMADLTAAERDLRKLLEDLEHEMQARFETTFHAVAEAFGQLFPQLFGGGEAELVLRRDDEAADQVGLDIVARPPGKRRQPLSLLSGGERALTAVALIFALLEVSQTPFVVFDEVDAALDEANVGRFCAALQRLAERCQVIIVTHNRGTIQTAGTVYGITMGDDGASQVISLQVETAVVTQ